MSILPCPSRRVTGSIVIFFMAFSLYLSPVQERCGKAEAVEGPYRVGDAADDTGRLLFRVRIDHGGHRTHKGRALVYHMGRRTVAAAAGHIDRRAEGAAPSAGCGPRTDEALVEE